MYIYTTEKPLNLLTMLTLTMASSPRGRVTIQNPNKQNLNQFTFLPSTTTSLFNPTKYKNLSLKCCNSDDDDDFETQRQPPQPLKELRFPSFDYYISPQQVFETYKIKKMASHCPGKNSWPEVLGMKGDRAVTIIEMENSLVTANLVPEGSNVTGDFRCDRVSVYVNQNNVITRVPTIG